MSKRIVCFISYDPNPDVAGLYRKYVATASQAVGDAADRAECRGTASFPLARALDADYYANVVVMPGGEVVEIGDGPAGLQLESYREVLAGTDAGYATFALCKS